MDGPPVLVMKIRLCILESIIRHISGLVGREFFSRFDAPSSHPFEEVGPEQWSMVLKPRAFPAS